MRHSPFLAAAAGKIVAGTVVLGALTLAGCASIDRLSLERDLLIGTLRERGLDPELVILPFGLTAEMRTWAQEAVGKRTSDQERILALQERLLDPDEMSLQYQWGYTGTAIEVFEQRRANCLAFTNLFIAMAREVGVEVYFLSVEDKQSYRRDGDLVVVSDHIAVGYGTQTERRILDFSADASDDYHFVRRISDLTAIAMFHSNRGAESLQAGHVTESIEWLRTATSIDPELASAWVNLGVALRRDEQLAEAEEAYERAIEADPRVYSAYQNLSALLRMQNRQDEAAGYERVLQSSPNQNPFSYLALGDIAYRSGDLRQAERFFRRAAMLGDQGEALAALGQTAMAQGDLRTARKMLKKLQKLEVDIPRSRQLALLLGAVGPA